MLSEIPVPIYKLNINALQVKTKTTKKTSRQEKGCVVKEHIA